MHRSAQLFYFGAAVVTRIISPTPVPRGTHRSVRERERHRASCSVRASVQVRRPQQARVEDLAYGR